MERGGGAWVWWRKAPSTRRGGRRMTQATLHCTGLCPRLYETCLFKKYKYKKNWDFESRKRWKLKTKRSGVFTRSYLLGFYGTNVSQSKHNWCSITFVDEPKKKQGICCIHNLYLGQSGFGQLDKWTQILECFAFQTTELQVYFCRSWGCVHDAIHRVSCDQPRA